MLDFNDIIEESVDNARANVYDEDVYFVHVNLHHLPLRLQLKSLVKRLKNMVLRMSMFWSKDQDRVVSLR